VDQAARLVQQRTAMLTETELDWQPPDGGWPLRRVLHHLARWQWLYAGLYGVQHHPREVVELVLTFEGELLAAKR